MALGLISCAASSGGLLAWYEPIEGSFALEKSSGKAQGML